MYLERIGEWGNLGGEQAAGLCAEAGAVGTDGAANRDRIDGG